MNEQPKSLGAILRAAKESTKASLADLTVLSPQNDPFRLDTPANHVKGQWLRDQMEACGLYETDARIHNRGLHYAIQSRGDATLPNGARYINDADCWAFLEDASNAARWLGYVDWEKVFDARNSEPIIRINSRSEPGYEIALDANLYLPDPDEIKPRIRALGFEARQEFLLVLYGEKTSLAGVLDPLAKEYGADLYLPSGEISNTMLATMARNGEQDGREMIVFVFADCDPAGYQMAVSIAHKLRAFQSFQFPGLRFRLLAPALTVEQVRTLGLPSTPLKDTELRAAGWRERYGVEQTEIDALATLQPDTLRQIASDAVEPFFDRSLKRREIIARQAWEAAAQEAFEEQVDSDFIEQIHARATDTLEALNEQLSQLTVAAADVDDLYLPPMDIPEPQPTGTQPAALVSSDMPLVDHIRTLKARKNYSGGV